MYQNVGIDYEVTFQFLNNVRSLALWLWTYSFTVITIKIVHQKQLSREQLLTKSSILSNFFVKHFFSLCWNLSLYEMDLSYNFLCWENVIWLILIPSGYFYKSSHPSLSNTPCSKMSWDQFYKCTVIRLAVNDAAMLHLQQLVKNKKAQSKPSILEVKILVKPLVTKHPNKLGKGCLKKLFGWCLEGLVKNGTSWISRESWTVNWVIIMAQLFSHIEE